jgi:hypothetical protein
MKSTMSKDDLRKFDKYFDQPFIRFQPGFVELFNLNGGILLCYLLYWRGRGWHEGWVYKTIQDMQYETGLSRDQQNTAIKKLKSMGVLEVKLKGIPATRHFRVNMRLIHSLLEIHKLDDAKTTKPYVENQQTITENKNPSESIT